MERFAKRTTSVIPQRNSVVTIMCVHAIVINTTILRTTSAVN